ALQSFEKLCGSPDPDPWPVRAAAEALRRVGYQNKVLRIIRHHLKRPNANPQLAATAIELMMTTRQCFDSLWFFFELKSGVAQQRAAAPLVQGLAEHQSKRLLRWLLWRRREMLFRD